MIKRKQILKLREELLSVEEERLAGNYGFSVDELEKSLNYIYAQIKF